MQNKMKTKELSEDVRKNIIEKYEIWSSYTVIRHELAVPRSTVRDTIGKHMVQLHPFRGNGALAS